MFDLGIVVPVRRGSSRIKNKTMLPFGGAGTLIEWKLGQLVQVIDPARIYLSSEDDELLGLADRFGVSRHKRDPHLAQDHVAPFRDVITGIVQHIPHDHIAWCTVVCPLMPPREYVESFRNYQERVLRGPHDSLLGVNLVKEYFWAEGKSLNYEATRDHTISQNLPDYHKVTNSIYMYNRRDILAREYFIGPNPYMQILSKFSGVDIDYIDDYRMARALHSIYVEDNMDYCPADWTLERI